MSDTKLPPINNKGGKIEEENDMNKAVNAPVSDDTGAAANAAADKDNGDNSAVQATLDEKKESDNLLIDTKAAKSEETAGAKPAPAKPAAKQRTKEDRDASFKFIMGYAKRECGSITLGIFFLIGGSLSDLAVPLFIGRVIDLLQEGDFDGIGTLCLYMLIIIFVSSYKQSSRF